MGTPRREQAAALAQSYPISLIIPVHNGGDHFRMCLESVRANDLAGVEVIVVDDGSTDDTAGWLAELGGQWPQLRVVSREDAGGPSVARNLGMAEARFGHLFFLDADIVLPARTIQWLRESLDLYSHRPSVIGVLGAYSEEIPDSGFWSQYKNLYTCYLYRTTETITPYVHTPVFCVRADALRELGGFDAGLRRGEDFRLGLRLAASGKRVVIDRRLSVTHLKHYTPLTLLAEDWRRMIQLRQLDLSPAERRLARGAHRLSRLLALALPLPTVAVALAALWWPPAVVATVAMIALFLLAQSRFLRYMRKRRGWSFAVRSAIFNWFEMGWAQLAFAASFVVR